MNKIDEIREVFNSISCLVAEGPEFMTSIQVIDEVSKEAIRGYNLCTHLLINQPTECHWLIRKMYSSGRVSQRLLAKIFKVSHSTIVSHLKGKYRTKGSALEGVQR